MIQLYKNGAYLLHGTELIAEEDVAKAEQAGAKLDKNVTKKVPSQHSIFAPQHRRLVDNLVKIRFDSDLPLIRCLRWHYSNGSCVRYGKIPHALCTDLLPQLPVRCRRHHQRR